MKLFEVYSGGRQTRRSDDVVADGSEDSDDDLPQKEGRRLKRKRQFSASDMSFHILFSQFV